MKKLRKRLLSIFMVLALISTAVPYSAFADDIPADSDEGGYTEPSGDDAEDGGVEIPADDGENTEAEDSRFDFDDITIENVSYSPITFRYTAAADGETKLKLKLDTLSFVKGSVEIKEADSEDDEKLDAKVKIKDGVISVTFDAVSGTVYQVKFIVSGEGSGTASISVSDSDSSESKDVDYSFDGSYSGESAVVTVTDDQGSPLSNVLVTLDSEDAAYTDDSGNAYFSGLILNKEYEYTVSGLPESYSFTGDSTSKFKVTNIQETSYSTFNGIKKDEEPEPTEEPAPEPTEEPEPEPTEEPEPEPTEEPEPESTEVPVQYTTVTVIVVDENGDPVEDVEAFIEDVTDVSATNADGAAYFDNIEVGRDYVANANIDGYYIDPVLFTCEENSIVYLTAVLEATPEPTEEPTPEPTEEPTPEPTEEPTPEPTEEPIEYTTVTITVVDENGDPVEGAEAFIEDVTDILVTNEYGEVYFEDIEVGQDYLANANIEGYYIDPVSFTCEENSTVYLTAVLEATPTPEPTEEPTPEPTEEPTPEPTEEPTPEPTEEPTPEPTEEPTPEPTEEPTPEPTEEPIEYTTVTITVVDENGDPVEGAEAFIEDVTDVSETNEYGEAYFEDIEVGQDYLANANIEGYYIDPVSFTCEENSIVYLTAVLEATPTPEPTEEPTPEPTEEPTPEPTEEPIEYTTVTIIVVDEDGDPVEGAEAFIEDVTDVSATDEDGAAYFEDIEIGQDYAASANIEGYYVEPVTFTCEEDSIVYLTAILEATPTPEPTEEPTPGPTEEPTPDPTEEPTPEPTEEPTPEPTEEPTPEPTEEPTPEPTEEPTPEPTEEPTAEPTEEPTPEPTEEPTAKPTEAPVNTRTIDVYIKWSDNSNSAGKRPDSVEIQLKNASEIKDTRSASADNNWSASWNNLDRTVSWTVATSKVDGYAKSYSTDGSTITVLYTYVGNEESSESSQSGISITALAVWNDNNNAYNTRPDSIAVNLKRNGEVYDTQYETADNNWTVTWNNLDRSYTWSISPVGTPAGYTKSGTSSGGTVTVTYVYQGSPTAAPESSEESSNSEQSESPTAAPSASPSVSPSPSSEPDIDIVIEDIDSTPKPSDNDTSKKQNDALLWIFIVLIILSAAGIASVVTILIIKRKGRNHR